YNPAVSEVLCRLARQANALRRGEKVRAARLIEKAELPRAGCMLIFDAAHLKKMSRHALAEMFRLIWRREGWPMQEMGFRAWMRVARVAAGEMPAADLPGPIRIRHRARVVQVGPPVRA